MNASAGSPAAPARRGRRRDRALLLAPALAFGSVIVTVWLLAGWWAYRTPRELVARQRSELTAGVRSIAMQTEPVLRQAENALHIVDLWLLRQQGRPDEAALQQLAEGVRSGSRGLVELMLVAPTGQLQRLRAGAGSQASIAGSPAFDEAAGLTQGRIAIGLPLRLGGPGGDEPLRLPLLMRLARPVGEQQLLLASVDLARLQAMQAPFDAGPTTALAMLRADGLALWRRPESPGFVGRRLFEQFPAYRQQLDSAEGMLLTSGAATDGRPRVGAFVTLPDFGIKLVLSDSQERVLEPFRQLRSLVFSLAAVLTLALLALTRWLGRLQRAARLREATLEATSNAIPLGMFRTDESGRMVYVNERYLQVHGLKREDMGWGWASLVRPEHRDMLVQRWKHHMASGEPLEVLSRMRRGDDGRLRWIAVRSAPVLLDERITGQAGTVEDVTERSEQEEARQALATVFDITPDLVCQVRSKGEIAYMNPAARRRLGLALDASLEGARVEQFFTVEQVDNYQRNVLPTALREGHWRGRSQVQLGADLVPMDITVLAHRDLRGRAETFSVMLRDVSEQVQAQRERERGEAMLLAIAHTARAQFLVGDTAGRVLFFNAAFEEARGVLLTDWTGRPLAELFGPADYALREPLIQAALAGEMQHVDLASGSDRAARMLDAQYGPLRVQSGEIEGLIAIELDVTEARREEARLRLASQTDALTQLLNRAGFEDGARQALAQPGRAALLYLDLDRFKPINDAHGHPTGDALLQAVALRLRHALRPGDLAARLGGDEFAVLLPSLAQAADAATVAAKLLQAVSAPYHIGALELEIGVSIGYCVAPDGGSDLEQLIAEADAHLYAAKRAGRGRFQGGELSG